MRNDNRLSLSLFSLFLCSVLPIKLTTRRTIAGKKVSCMYGCAENAGPENAGPENAGPNRRA